MFYRDCSLYLILFVALTASCKILKPDASNRHLAVSAESSFDKKRFHYNCRLFDMKSDDPQPNFKQIYEIDFTKQNPYEDPSLGSSIQFKKGDLLFQADLQIEPGDYMGLKRPISASIWQMSSGGQDNHILASYYSQSDRIDYFQLISHIKDLKLILECKING